MGDSELSWKTILIIVIFVLIIAIAVSAINIYFVRQMLINSSINNIIGGNTTIDESTDNIVNDDTVKIEEKKQIVGIILSDRKLNKILVIGDKETAANTNKNATADTNAVNTDKNTAANTDKNAAANTDKNTAANTDKNTDKNTAADTNKNADKDVNTIVNAKHKDSFDFTMKEVNVDDNKMGIVKELAKNNFGIDVGAEKGRRTSNIILNRPFELDGLTKYTFYIVKLPNKKAFESAITKYITNHKRTGEWITLKKAKKEFARVNSQYSPVINAIYKYSLLKK